MSKRENSDAVYNYSIRNLHEPDATMLPIPLRSSPFVSARYRPLSTVPRLVLPLFVCQVRACFPGLVEGGLTGSTRMKEMTYKRGLSSGASAVLPKLDI